VGYEMNARCLKGRLRDESGQALVLAIAIVVVGLILGLTAVAFALNTSQQSVHDERYRGAQQAADAGEQQQLYLQSSSNATEYGVAASVGGLVDCIVPELNASLQIVGVQAVASDNGVCPQDTSTSGGAPSTPFTALDNENYYDSVFFPNEVTQSPSGSPAPTGFTGVTTEFPEIVSLGCHSTNNSCNMPPGNNAYWRQLTLLQPTGPLNAIEAENDVTIKATPGSGIAENLVPGLCSLLGAVTQAVCNLLDTATLPATVVGGNIVANNNLFLPQTVAGVTPSLGTVATDLLNGTSIASLLSSTSGLGGLLGSLGATLDYSSCLAGNSPSGSSTAQTQTCAEGLTAASGSAPLTVNLNTSLVPVTGSPCQEGNPSSNCKLVRNSFTLSGSYTSAATFATSLASGSSIQGTGTGKWSDINGDLIVNSGATVNINPGTYTFCNVQVNSGGTIEGPSSSGAVRIFILAPSQCGGSNSGGATPVMGGAVYEGGSGGTNTQGNFVVAGGITGNATLGTLVNGVSGVVDPTAFQIYVSGDALDDTQVSVGVTNTPSLLQSFIVYAPASQVTVDTSAAFEGALIGDNAIVQAAAVLQDLSLGNNALSSVLSSYQPGQAVQCDGSVNALTTVASGASAAAASAAETADTKGCA
jgi:hypothetical protein